MNWSSDKENENQEVLLSSNSDINTLKLNSFLQKVAYWYLKGICCETPEFSNIGIEM